MDGTLAVLGLLVGLTDMGFNYCGTGCVARNPTDGRLSLSSGTVIYDEDTISEEIYLRYELPYSFGPFQPAVGASATTQGDLWVGAGAVWTQQSMDDAIYVQFHLMPGLYAQGDGPDLGHVVEFRSGIEIGYEAANGWRWGLSYDHRSNAGLSSFNPGMETLQLRLSIPLR